jgi:hypothetical protein
MEAPKVPLTDFRLTWKHVAIVYGVGAAAVFLLIKSKGLIGVPAKVYLVWPLHLRDISNAAKSPKQVATA